MRRSDFVTFDDFAQSPARHDIGDTAVFLDAADDDLGDEFAIAIDKQFAVFKHALILTDVQHDKIPLGINHKNFAFEIGAQFYDVIRSNKFRKLIIQTSDRVL